MFEIVEHLNPTYGNIFYEVVENDGFNFKRLGWFRDKQKAEQFIIYINEEALND